MKTLGVPGMAVAVIEDGKVLHLNTYGLANIEYHLPVSQNTSFQIASVTKLFNATLQWALVGLIKVCHCALKLDDGKLFLLLTLITVCFSLTARNS